MWCPREGGGGRKQGVGAFSWPFSDHMHLTFPGSQNTLSFNSRNRIFSSVICILTILETTENYETPEASNACAQTHRAIYNQFIFLDQPSSSHFPGRLVGWLFLA